MMALVELLGGVRASLFAALALLALAFGGVQSYRLHSAQATIAEQTTASILAAKEYAEWKAAIEAEKAEAIAALDIKHREEQKRAKAEADRTIAELRNGTRQLRKRLTCSAEQSGAQSETIGGADGERAGGLTEEDAEFLIREAADSDRKSVKINSLIEGIEELLKNRE